VGVIVATGVGVGAGVAAENSSLIQLPEVLVNAPPPAGTFPNALTA